MPNGLGDGAVLGGRPLPVTVYVWAIVVVVGALATTNPVTTAASIVVLVLLAKLLWRPGEPPILLFAASYQWIQVSTLVFLADFQSKPLAEMSFSPSVERAIWLGLAGLVLLALGMHIGARRLGKSRAGF